MAEADTSIIPALGDEPQQPSASPDSPNRRLVWILLLAGFAILLLAYIIAAIAAGLMMLGSPAFAGEPAAHEWDDDWDFVAD